MIEKELTIQNKLGLHARPAAMFVHEAARFRSTIMVNKEGLEINGKSVMGLMLLAAECGSRLLVKIDGPDEREAASALEQLLLSKFGED